MSIKALPIAIAASVAAVVAAHAADLPSRKGAPVAPAAYSSLPYNWTGPYIGLGGGYDRTQGSGTTGLGGRKNTRSRGAFGGYAGYNVQLGPIVYGLEADAALLSSRAKSNALAGAAKVRERYDGSVRARAGYAIDRWLVYGTGGFAFRDQQITTSGLIARTKTQTGWIAGAGVERALTDNLVARLEYTHADYGRTKGLVPVGLGRGKSTDDRVMAGLSYKFGM
ncbi:MAG: porin family protein [Hyphomonadaceae bacterium]|nr:porin family protein [Hyphomonadaceae bacterium]